MRLLKRTDGVALLSLFAIGIAGCAEESAPVRANSLEGYWGSGAEVSSYELDQSRYGANHPGHAELVFAREPFLPEEQVKRDSGDGPAVPTLKLNALRTFNTGIYSYRTMQSTFAPFDRTAYPHVLKTDLGVQDWCGQVFEQMNRRGNEWAFQGFSYFQAEGDSKARLPGVWLEDEIMLALRFDPQGLPVGEVEMIPALLHGRFHHQDPKVESATATLGKEGKLMVYRIEYNAIERTLEIAFHPELPYLIEEWIEKTDKGTTTARRMKTLRQIEYWRLNQPKDKGYRRDLGLEPYPR